MKQKVVIQVYSMNCSKSRTTGLAMKIAVSVAGVISAEIQGDDKNQIVVTGEGIDTTCLTLLIRKKVGFTQLVSVTAIPDKKEEEKKKPDVEVKPIHVLPPCQYGTPQVFLCEAPSNHHQDSCTIM